MEYLDVVNEAGLPTGKIVSRDEAHRDGICHRTAHVWVIRKTSSGWDVLLQKRSMEKESFPGMYDTSSAGHIPAGSEPLDSALRELEEELGISASPSQLAFAGMFRIHYEKPFHGRLFRDHEITWVYVYAQPVDTDHLTLQKSEVDEVRWFDLTSLLREIESNRDVICVPAQGLQVLCRYLGLA
mgnify:CR=1 FL=1